MKKGLLLISCIIQATHFFAGRVEDALKARGEPRFLWTDQEITEAADRLQKQYPSEKAQLTIEARQLQISQAWDRLNSSFNLVREQHDYWPEDLTWVPENKISLIYAGRLLEKINHFLKYYQTNKALYSKLIPQLESQIRTLNYAFFSRANQNAFNEILHKIGYQKKPLQTPAAKELVTKWVETLVEERMQIISPLINCKDTLASQASQEDHSGTGPASIAFKNFMSASKAGQEQICAKAIRQKRPLAHALGRLIDKLKTLKTALIAKK